MTNDQPLASPVAALLAAAFGSVAIWFSSAQAAEPPITAACFSADGTTVVVGSQAGLQWRDWPALTVRRQWKTNLVQVHHLALEPASGRLAVSGGSPAEAGGAEIYAWPPEGQPLRSWRGGEDVWYQFAWDELAVGWVAACGDGNLYRGMEDGGELTAVGGHSRGVLAVASAGGGWWCSAGMDRSLRVWRGERFEAVRSLDNHSGVVHDLALRPVAAGQAAGVRMLASASEDRTVRFWQPAIGRLVRFARLPSPPLDIDWLPDGSRLVAACTDGRLRIVDPDSAELVAELAGVPAWAYTLVVAPSGREALVGGADGQVRRVAL